jgi:DNA-binding transcriptional ArsR family regulator
VTQSAVSQHLRVLRQAGLVNGQRRGYHVHYSLDRDRLAQYKARVQETLGEDFGYQVEFFCLSILVYCQILK